jgi:uncharacterized membrane protein
VLDIIKDGTLYLAAGVEAGAALIIALAAIQAVARTLLLFARLGPNVQAKENVRLSFAGWLALALEFELAADILRTAVAPTWNDIGQLAAIAILRTALNYFVQKEIDRAGMRQDGPPVSET